MGRTKKNLGGLGEEATAEDVAQAYIGSDTVIPIEEYPDTDIGEDRVAEAPEAFQEFAGDGRDAQPVASGSILHTEAILDRMTRLMELMMQAQASGNNPTLDRLTAAFERMAANQLEAADRVAKATRTASRPSNEAVPQISVLNPRGDKDFPRPALKCRVLFPWQVEHESCTREEIELLNLLVPGDYMVERNDGTKVKLIVRATYKADSDTIDTLLVNHDTAFNNDYHWLMPPMKSILRQMLRQNPKTKALANVVLSMDEELELIQAGLLNDGTQPTNGKVVSVGE